MINEELTIRRIEELEEYISNFPQSVLCPIFRREINFLCAELDYKPRTECLRHLKPDTPQK